MAPTRASACARPPSKSTAARATSKDYPVEQYCPRRENLPASTKAPTTSRRWTWSAGSWARPAAQTSRPSSADVGAFVEAHRAHPVVGKAVGHAGRGAGAPHVRGDGAVRLESGRPARPHRPECQPLPDDDGAPGRGLAAARTGPSWRMPRQGKAARGPMRTAPSTKARSRRRCGLRATNCRRWRPRPSCFWNRTTLPWTSRTQASASAEGAAAQSPKAPTWPGPRARRWPAGRGLPPWPSP